MLKAELSTLSPEHQKLVHSSMYKLLTASQDYGNASAVAIILVAAVIPVLIFNLRQFRAVEARR